jgi:hypothetical protein
MFHGPRPVLRVPGCTQRLYLPRAHRPKDHQMIYRILASTSILSDERGDTEGPVRVVGTRICGAFSAGVTEGFGGLPAPGFQVPRARFYFTELGWKQFGRAIYAAAQREGRAVRGIRLKNPHRSQLVYQDAYQVAILPRR